MRVTLLLLMSIGTASQFQPGLTRAAVRTAPRRAAASPEQESRKLFELKSQEAQMRRALKEITQQKAALLKVALARQSIGAPH